MTLKLSSASLLVSVATMASTFAAMALFLKQNQSNNGRRGGLTRYSSFPSFRRYKTYILVGDIGGTNTRLALYYYNGCKATDTPLYTKQYLNERHITDSSKTFETEIFLQFLSECTITFDDRTQIIACFAVAGPVSDNQVKLTNLGGVVLDGKSVTANKNGLLQYITRCKIVNDFVGQGYGLLDLDHETEVIELTPGSRKKMLDQPFGPKACVGAGTGLGECFLTTSSLHPDEGYECYPSEGGHVDFVPRDSLQQKLLDKLKEKFNEAHRVSVERVVSGKGLANVYGFLAEERSSVVNETIHADFLTAGSLQGKVIGMNANSENPDPLCKQAMEIMMSTYGKTRMLCVFFLNRLCVQYLML